MSVCYNLDNQQVSFPFKGIARWLEDCADEKLQAAAACSQAQASISSKHQGAVEPGSVLGKGALKA